MKFTKFVFIALCITMMFVSISSAGTNRPGLKITSVWVGQSSFSLTTINSSNATKIYYFQVGQYSNNADAIKMLLSSALYCFQNNLYIDIYSEGVYNTAMDNASQFSIHN